MDRLPVCPYPDQLGVVIWYDEDESDLEFIRSCQYMESLAHKMGYAAFRRSLERRYSGKANIRRIYWLKENPDTKLREKIIISKPEQFEAYLRECVVLGRDSYLFASREETMDRLPVCPYPDQLGVVIWYDEDESDLEFIRSCQYMESLAHKMGYAAFRRSLERRYSGKANIRRIYWLKENPDTKLREKIIISKPEQFEAYLRECVVLGRDSYLFASYKDTDRSYDHTFTFGEGQLKLH